MALSNLEYASLVTYCILIANEIVAFNVQLLCTFLRDVKRHNQKGKIVSFIVDKIRGKNVTPLYSQLLTVNYI